MDDAAISKDYRPAPQPDGLAVLIVGSDGRPVRTAMWPGNTTDVATPHSGDRSPAAAASAIDRVRVVADRGMISAETIAGPRSADLAMSWACASAPPSRCASLSSTIPRRSFPSTL